MLDVHSYDPIFLSFKKLFTTKLCQNELDLEKLQHALEQTLKYSLHDAKDLNEAKNAIFKQYYSSAQHLLNSRDIPLTFSLVVSLITFFNDPQRLKNVMDFVPNTHSNILLFLSNLTKQKKLTPLLISPTRCEWPEQIIEPPEDTPVEVLDAALQQLLALPHQIKKQKQFIQKILSMIVAKKPEYLQNDYCYQVIGYLRHPVSTDFEMIKQIIITVWQSHQSDVDIENNYPIALLTFFAENPKLLDAPHIAKIYQDSILRDHPISCKSLIGAVETEKQADFLLSLLQLSPSFHTEESGVKLCAFLDSKLLVSRLIRQINAKQQLEFFESLKGSLAKLDIDLFASLLENCSDDFGKFAINDSGLQDLISKNTVTRICVIKRNFVESISLSWLTKFSYNLEEATDLLGVISNTPKSDALFEPALEQFKKAMQHCREQQPPQKIAIFKSIQKILTTIHPDRLKKVLESQNDFLMSQRSLLDFVLNSGQDFTLLADSLLRSDGIRVHLLKEMIAYNESNYLQSDDFKIWFSLPAATLNKLISLCDEIKQAIINRTDFTLMIIAKIRNIPLVESLIQECDLTVDNLSQILVLPELHPKVAQAVLQKFKLLDFKTISPQQIAAFLTAINQIHHLIKFSEMTIADDLKDRLRTLFSNPELRSTSWVRIFAEYYAKHPEEMSGLLFSDEEKALINLAQLKLTPQKPLAHVITEQIALLMLRNPELNDEQFAVAIKSIGASKNLNEIWIVKFLAFACNSLHRAKLICEACPFPAYSIYRALTYLPEDQNANKKIAFKNLLFGVLQAKQSLKPLQRIPNLLSYFLQSKDPQFTVSQLLSLLKKDKVGFDFDDVYLLLSSHPDLSIHDFNLIPYQFFAIDYLFIVAGNPKLNAQLSHLLLEKYCLAAPKLYIADYYSAITKALKPHFSESQINSLLIQFFQTPHLNHGPTKKEFVTITREEFNKLSENNLHYAKIPYREGENGCFALSDTHAVVFDGWYRDSTINLQHYQHNLDCIWQLGIVATEVGDQVAVLKSGLQN